VAPAGWFGGAMTSTWITPPPGFRDRSAGVIISARFLLLSEGVPAALAKLRGQQDAGSPGLVLLEYRWFGTRLP
jgi:hypothetical protein